MYNNNNLKKWYAFPNSFISVSVSFLYFLREGKLVDQAVWMHIWRLRKDIFARFIWVIFIKIKILKLVHSDLHLVHETIQYKFVSDVLNWDVVKFRQSLHNSNVTINSILFCNFKFLLSTLKNKFKRILYTIEFFIHLLSLI